MKLPYCFPCPKILKYQYWINPILGLYPTFMIPAKTDSTHSSTTLLPSALYRWVSDISTLPAPQAVQPSRKPCIRSHSVGVSFRTAKPRAGYSTSVSLPPPKSPPLAFNVPTPFTYFAKLFAVKPSAKLLAVPARALPPSAVNPCRPSDLKSISPARCLAKSATRKILRRGWGVPQCSAPNTRQAIDWPFPTIAPAVAHFPGLGIEIPAFPVLAIS